ncbi:flagellar basal body-associated FliL family protein [Piscinibacter terrae]|uniref:Flagellar protein FliL n=1 Tax=Piscinibacter terrae TaxID=2496871 RepID=A0A3N7HSR8_9BURK|nr:flagellar basal body-associated FliL family protein [Albitalea terrae]RQP25254.1 flagellar basal body rod protein [Albitalea terrae]
MSAAAAETVEDAVEAPAPKKGKKKLIIIIAAAVLLAGTAGGGAFMWKKKKAAEAAAAAAAAAEEGDEEAAPNAHAEAEKKKDEHHGPPTFLPLDPFVINLADKDQERYAQVGLTLELSDAKVADQLKAYMPAIRNGVLMVLAQKTSQELLTRKGKEQLANEITREAVRPLGIELAMEGEPKGAGKTSIDDSPVRRVHFSSFIIQ